MVDGGTGLFDIPIEDNTVYYVARGTAANVLEKGATFIDPSQLHEYPQEFVGKVHDIVDNAILILFDPFTRDTPYIVYHNFANPEKTSLNVPNEGWTKESDYVWKFDGDGKHIGRIEGKRYTMTVYNYRTTVTFDGVKYSSELDLKDELIGFAGKLTDTKNSYLLYHDFIGGNPIHVNNILKENLNRSFMERCLIDFSYGMDYGCLFVTNNPSQTLIFKEGKIFNPHGVGEESIKFFKEDIVKHPGIVGSIAKKTYDKISMLHRFPRSLMSCTTDEVREVRKHKLIEEAKALSKHDCDFEQIVKCITGDKMDDLIKYVKETIERESSIFFKMVDEELPDIVPDYDKPYEFTPKIRKIFKDYMTEQQNSYIN